MGIFCDALCSVFLFNAVLGLDFLGRALSKNPSQVVAQGVMVPVAAAIGPLADRVGRMPLFMAGFAIIPVRGLVVSLVHHREQV